MQQHAHKAVAASLRRTDATANTNITGRFHSALPRLLTTAALLALGAGLLTPHPAHALAVTVYFDTWITGTPIGTGNSVATLDISDGVNGAVNFKLTNTVGQLEPLGLWQSNTGIKQLHLSYDRAPSTPDTLEGSGSELRFTNLAGNDQWSIPTSIAVEPRTNASYEFNIHFGWLTTNSGGGMKRFTDGEWFTWSIDSTDPANPVSILNFLTAVDPPDPAKPPSIGLAHVFSLTDGSTKEVVDFPPLPRSTVAEPSTLLLFAGALGSLAAIARRRRSIALR